MNEETDNMHIIAYYLAIMNMLQMNELWKHYAKWNKPDIEAYKLYDSTYMKYLEWSNS